MHEVYIDILLNTIFEQYGSEEKFYQNVLGIEQVDWEAWKNGTGGMSSENSQKVKNLFSDYEWMLVQKVLRQTIIFPEKRNEGVSEYKKMKTRIAQTWLQSELADVEILSNDEDANSQLLDLRVTLAYGEWGYDDIVSFRLPATIQQQIKNEKVALLDWVNENLADTYNN